MQPDVANRYDQLQEIAGTVSRETYMALEQYEEAFREWNKRINLAAGSTLDQFWERHVLDSAQIVRIAPDAMRWVDLGSGGGLPGAVIAVLMRDRPGAFVHLVESNRKKTAFLINVLGRTGAPAKVHPVRIEDAPALTGPADIITARALAPLPKLLQLAGPWLAAGARGLFHKGRGYRGEIEESRQLYRFDLVEHPSRIEPQGAILEITGLKSGKDAPV